MKIVLPCHLISFSYTILCLHIWEISSILDKNGNWKSNVTEERNVMKFVHYELSRFHRNNILTLEKNCFVGNCNFRRAKQIIRDPIKFTKYWNYLNCVKYGYACPINGHWGKWGKFEPCSARCGEGVRVRWRDCDTPYPMYGGSTCSGVDHELAPCEHIEGWNCAFNPSLPGVWSLWSAWSHCLGSKKQRGIKKRTRHCLPNLVTTACEAYSKQQVTCRRPILDVDGQWSLWENWSTCTTQFMCGDGVQIRQRSCSNPHVSGEGVDCVGTSVQTKTCSGIPCSQDNPELAHFLPDSYVRYKAIPHSYYLNVFLRFIPNSDNGLLFQYSTESSLQQATKSGNVKIKKKKIHSFVNFQEKEDQNIEAKVEQVYQPVENEDYVYANIIAAEKLEVHVVINGSEKIVIRTHGVKNSQWNDLRISIISDMVWIRLNDGENIQSRLEEYFSKAPEISNITHPISGFVSRMAYKVKSQLMEFFTPDRRQIFASFDGEVGLGAVRKGYQGFRGYISHFVVNYRSYNLKIRPESEISQVWDPFRDNRMSYGFGVHSHLSLLTHFNGKQSVELPLLVSWMGTKSSRILGRQSGEVATFEIVLKPECEDGLFLFIQGSNNRMTHWKLSVVEGRSVRLTMSYGGEITLLKSGRDLLTNSWNKVTLQLVYSGFAHLEVNKKSYYTNVPTATSEHVPIPTLHIGGYGKPIEHTHELLGENPSTEFLKEFKSFVGYIYSVRQNDFIHLIEDIPNLNTFNMLSSFFMSNPAGIGTVFFLPSSSEKSTSEKNAQDDLLSWEEHSEKRSITCKAPVPDNVRQRGNITWYRNGQRIKDSPFHLTRTYVGERSQDSYVYFGKSLDSSHDQSGFYQCVMSYFGKSYLIMSYVIAVIPEDVSHYGAGGLGSILRGYSLETSILILAGIGIGTIIVLLILLSCFRTIFGKLSKWRKTNSTQESIPLMETNVTQIPRTKTQSYSDYSSEDDSSNHLQVTKQKSTFGKITTAAMQANKLKKKILSRREDKYSSDVSSDESYSPRPSFTKLVGTAMKVNQAHKKLSTRTREEESKPLIEESSSSNETTVFRMGSEVKVRKKKRRTEFKNKLQGRE
uniref:uncharacterized protein LOC120327276 n=1 Tax=Styela clava TaxID=7725 RepID=UPI00193A563A|nr:uncharacterized protein LOC120327276 [Styela clava]